MRVIAIGTERGLFKEGSGARIRIAKQGALFEELHIIVFTKKDKIFFEQKIADNVFVYPTRSWSRLWYIRDAVAIARRCMAQWVISPPRDGKTIVSGQDPFESGLAALKIAQLLNAPLQLQLHTDMFSPLFTRSWLNHLRVFWARRLLPRAAVVRVVSDSIKERLVASRLVSQERVVVLPVYVDLTSFGQELPIEPTHDLRALFPEFKFIALTASRLTPEKDIGVAVRAIAALSKEAQHLGLVIVGEGPEKMALTRLARHLSIDHRVRFLPWQKHLGGLYRSANVFVLTSSFEGFGLTIAEALLSGTPVIATRVGLAQELHDGSEILTCAPGDVSCFVKKIRLLMNDHALREVLTVNGRQAMLRRMPDEETYQRLYKSSFELAFSMPERNNDFHEKR